MEEQQPFSASNPAKSTEADVEAARQQMLREILAGGIDSKLHDLEPPQAPGLPKWQSRLSIAVLAFIALMIIGGLFSPAGLLSHVRLPNSEQNDLPIRIFNGGQHQVLFANGDSGGLTVQSYDLLSNQVLDISRGRQGIRHASLNNDDSGIALAIAEPAGTSLYVSKLAGGESRIFDTSALTRSISSSLGWISASICPWSDLLWSPTDTQIAFFICSQDSSALFVTDSSSGAEPIYQVGTKSATTEPRSAIWTGANKIVATGGDNGVDSVIEVDPTQSQYKIIYGPRN